MGVHASSHEYGETSTSTPPGRSSLAHWARNAAGSGSRHRRLAASTASWRPNASKSEPDPPPPSRDRGSTHASPSRNETLARSTRSLTAPVSLRVTSPSRKHVYRSEPLSFMSRAAVMKALEESRPSTMAKCLASSKVAPPTAHPMSSARPAGSVLLVLTLFVCLAHRSAHLCVNLSASWGPSLYGSTSFGSPK